MTPAVRPARILLVEDDPTMTDVVARYLRREGHEVTTAGDGLQAVAMALGRPPDLVVLDLMLPGIDGLEVCRRLREHGSVPILMLTARGEPADRVLGLDLGADDYLVKPFSPRELVARMNAVLRRTQPTAAVPEVLRFGSLRIDPAAREVALDGSTVSLTAREFDLLAFLAAHPRQVFERTQLLEHVWGYAIGDTSTVTVHVRRLREKIEADPSAPRLVRTVRGVGYRFDPSTADGAQP